MFYQFFLFLASFLSIAADVSLVLVHIGLQSGKILQHHKFSAQSYNADFG